MKRKLKVGDMLDNIYCIEILCIYDHENARILYEGTVENAQKNGTGYDDWIISGMKTYSSNVLVGGKGSHYGIMIEVLSPKHK